MQRQNILIFLCITSPSFPLAYSPLVLKKDIFVPWEITILTSRDELLIERRGQWDSWLLQVPSSLSIHTCMWHLWRNIYFSLGWYVSIEFRTTFQSRQTHVLKEEEDVDICLLCRPHELCCSLHILTCWEIDATLLCSDALRYICRDNEIAFCPDWMGWWHRYEIAPVFPWLLCVFHIDTSSCVLGCLTCIGLCRLNHWKLSTQELSPKLPSKWCSRNCMQALQSWSMSQRKTKRVKWLSGDGSHVSFCGKCQWT